MPKWLLRNSEGSQLIVEAYTLADAAQIADNYYWNDTKGPIIFAEAYYGSVEPINKGISRRQLYDDDAKT